MRYTNKNIIEPINIRFAIFILFNFIIIISIFYIADRAEHTSIYPGCTGNRGRCEGRRFTRFFINTKTGLTCFFSYRNAYLRRRKTMKKNKRENSRVTKRKFYCLRCFFVLPKSGEKARQIVLTYI